MRPCDYAEYQPDYDPAQVMADWHRFVTKRRTGYNQHKKSYIIYHTHFNAYRKRLGRTHPLMVNTVRQLYQGGGKL